MLFVRKWNNEFPSGTQSLARFSASRVEKRVPIASAPELKLLCHQTATQVVQVIAAIISCCDLTIAVAADS